MCARDDLGKAVHSEPEQSSWIERETELPQPHKRGAIAVSSTLTLGFSRENISHSCVSQASQEAKTFTQAKIRVLKSTTSDKYFQYYQSR